MAEEREQKSERILRGVVGEEWKDKEERGSQSNRYPQVAPTPSKTFTTSLAAISTGRIGMPNEERLYLGDDSVAKAAMAVSSHWISRYELGRPMRKLSIATEKELHSLEETWKEKEEMKKRLEFELSSLAKEIESRRNLVCTFLV
jgi:hypothetical protein